MSKDVPVYVVHDSGYAAQSVNISSKESATVDITKIFRLFDAQARCLDIRGGCYIIQTTMPAKAIGLLRDITLVVRIDNLKIEDNL